MPSRQQLKTYGLTRRQAIQHGMSAAIALSCGKAWGAASERDRTFEYGDALEEFPYSAVGFQPGPHQRQLDQTHGILMELNEDSLLRPFRFLADLPAPGFELGGWYSSDDRDPGHSFGQWISALSRYYAITGDEKTKEKVF